MTALGRVFRGVSGCRGIIHNGGFVVAHGPVSRTSLVPQSVLDGLGSQAEARPSSPQHFRNVCQVSAAKGSDRRYLGSMPLTPPNH